MHIHALVHGAAQIAIGEDTQQAPLLVDDGGHAQPLARHFHQGLAQQGIRDHHGHGLAGSHHIIDQQQQAPS